MKKILTILVLWEEQPAKYGKIVLVEINKAIDGQSVIY
jgi:hypothetical protein